MERRDILKAGVAAGLGSAGCLPLRVGERAVEAAVLPDLRERLARMDRDLAMIDGLKKFTHLTLPSDPLRRRRGPVTINLSHDSHLSMEQMASAARSLYLVGTFHDLPLEAQLHPELQRRMLAETPAMTEGALSMVEYLRGQTPKQLEQVKSALRSNPDLIHDVCSMLDRVSQRTEVDNSRRKKLRMMANQLTWRMEKQSPSTVIGEYLNKVDRVLARADRHAEGGAAQTLRSAGMETGVTEEQVASIMERWQHEPISGAGGDVAPEPTSSKVSKAGRGVSLFGLIMAAVGLVGGIIGIALLGAASTTLVEIGAVLTTVGGVLLILGIVIAVIGLLVIGGAAIASATSKPPAPAPAPAQPLPPGSDPRAAPPPAQAEPPPTSAPPASAAPPIAPSSVPSPPPPPAPDPASH